MAVSNTSSNPSQKSQNRCIMCEGAMEKSNFGVVCNTCRDKMRKMK